MLIMNEATARDLAESFLQTSFMEDAFVESMASVKILPDEGYVALAARMKKALQMFHQDITTMEEGEERIFEVRDRFDVYNLDKRINNARASARRNSDTDKMSFRVNKFPERGIVLVRREFNLEDYLND